MCDAERVQNIWKVHLHISGKSSSLDYKGLILKTHRKRRGRGFQHFTTQGAKN